MTSRRATPFVADLRRQAALDYLAAVRNTGSPSAIRAAEYTVVLTHLPFATMIAGRYQHRGLHGGDLRQLARLGLAKAARRWDPEVCSQFQRLAYPTIVSEIERYLRHQAEVIRPSRSVQHLRPEIGAGPEIGTGPEIDTGPEIGTVGAELANEEVRPGQRALSEASLDPFSTPGDEFTVAARGPREAPESPRPKLRRITQRRRKTAGRGDAAPRLVALPSSTHRSS